MSQSAPITLRSQILANIDEEKARAIRKKNELAQMDILTGYAAFKSLLDRFSAHVKDCVSKGDVPTPITLHKNEMAYLETNKWNPGAINALGPLIPLDALQGTSSGKLSDWAKFNMWADDEGLTLNWRIAPSEDETVWVLEVLRPTPAFKLEEQYMPARPSRRM